MVGRVKLAKTSRKAVNNGDLHCRLSECHQDKPTASIIKNTHKYSVFGGHDRCIPCCKRTEPENLGTHQAGGVVSVVCRSPGEPVENKHSHPRSSSFHPEQLGQYTPFPTWGLGSMGLTPRGTPKYIICMLAKRGGELADSPTPFRKQKEGAGLGVWLFQKHGGELGS